jgi:2-octaprenyl-6-methoxyphenol hydroxylase
MLIENHFIFEALKKRVLAQKNITVFCPNSYQEISFGDEKNQVFNLESSCKKQLEILLNDQRKITADLLLACDGRFSALRKGYEIKTLEKNYQQTAITCKIKHEFSHENVAFEKFFAGGPLAVLPLKNSDKCTRS